MLTWSERGDVCLQLTLIRSFFKLSEVRIKLYLIYCTTVNWFLKFLVCIVDHIVLGSLYSLLNNLWQSNKRRISKGFPRSGAFPWSLTKSGVSCWCVDCLLCNCIYFSISNYCWWMERLIVTGNFANWSLELGWSNWYNIEKYEKLTWYQSYC